MNLDRLRRLLGKKTKKGRYPSYRKRAPAIESRANFKADAPAKKSPRKRSKFAELRWYIMKTLTRFAVISGGIALILFAILWFSLPSIDHLDKFAKTNAIVVESEDGQIIGTFGDVYGEYVPFDELPASLVDTIIATEDRNFYYHPGIDPLGLLRASWANFRAGHVVQGGSTITQQLAKNLFLTPERSLMRKLKEALLALKLEWKFTKKQIFTIYANRVYLGAGSYGVDAASRRYFGKPAREMSLSESAIIAGLLKAPSRYAPTSNPKQSIKRAEQVLLNLADAKYITKEQASKAIKELKTALAGDKHISSSNLYFADYVIEQIPELIGQVDEDIVVKTTLRPNYQFQAESAIAQVMDRDGDKLHATQAALVSMTPDGAVRALIGGRNYGTSQYNRATQALRQPGSSFKMFVYLAGLESGQYTPDTEVNDQPVTVNGWTPANYSGKYEGEMPLRQAVAHSINSVAVQVSESIGRSNVVSMAKRLGITSEIDPVPSVALGACEVNLIELTGAYAHLSADGKQVTPYAITEIRSKKGALLYTREEEDRPTVLRADIVGMMNDLLSGVIRFGTGTKANIGRSAAGKTGTTSDYRDAWFMGYTPDLVTGVWVGNDDNTMMKKVTGGTLPAPIWATYMKAALDKTPASNLPIRVSAPLPWQRGNVREPELTPVAPPPAEAGAQAGDGAHMGDHFWKTLEQVGER